MRDIFGGLSTSLNRSDCFREVVFLMLRQYDVNILHFILRFVCFFCCDDQLKSPSLLGANSRYHMMCILTEVYASTLFVSTSLSIHPEICRPMP